MLFHKLKSFRGEDIAGVVRDGVCGPRVVPVLSVHPAHVLAVRVINYQVVWWAAHGISVAALSLLPLLLGI